MKTCPVCHNNYPDDAMMFCLADGARLLQETTAADPNATWHLPSAGSMPGRPVTNPEPTVASPTASAEAPPPTVAYRPEPVPVSGHQFPAPPSVAPERSRRSALPWVFAIVLVIAGAGVLIAWLVTRSPGETTQTRSQTATPSPATSPSPSPEATTESDGHEGNLATATPYAVATPGATPSPTPVRQPGKGDTEITVIRPPTPPRDPTPSGPRFGRMIDNSTFTGTNLTYYPRTSAALCRADCAGNGACRGYTWVKPGGYNPGDSPMCYLIKVVGTMVPHTCCMSQLKVN